MENVLSIPLNEYNKFGLQKCSKKACLGYVIDALVNSEMPIIIANDILHKLVESFKKMSNSSAIKLCDYIFSDDD